ncbi:DUF3348 family protein [Inhella gelatinilytica]|uniref:DUF3348 family protein n=1 Tax=Inhella gelatinilytica TaxID=2795030 RepID=A0A931IUJ3_9BURK|nr:DUF3348 family protein [Inhella gelatinilytica]MBH9551786.1 DUF3348 family protein [Inhella gelatinilytica]
MQARHQQGAPHIGSGSPGWTASPALPHVLQRWGLRLPLPARGPVGPQLAEALSWRDAVALAQVLKTPSAEPAPDAAHRRLAAREWAEAARERLVAELQAGFADPVLVQDGPEAPARAAQGLEAVAPFKLHHSSQQRSMAARMATLRGRLRTQLAGTTPRLARLAQLDAVFEPAWAAREQPALAGLPSMTVQRGLRLQAAAPEAAQDARAWPPTGWRGQLWTELQDVLHAELALRLQPVLGLIEALQHDDPCGPIRIETP